MNKLTPREPTPEMVKAAIDQWVTSFADIWRFMHDAAPSGWQPIETAPKGAVVLLAAEFDGPGDWRVKCGTWVHGEGWRIWGASWEPTHWMPLPAPPKGE